VRSGNLPPMDSNALIFVTSSMHAISLSTTNIYAFKHKRFIRARTITFFTIAYCSLSQSNILFIFLYTFHSSSIHFIFLPCSAYMYRVEYKISIQ
jgi:hypothetical protein